jgi:hypothetical protein
MTSQGNADVGRIPLGRSRMPARPVIGVLSALLLYGTLTRLPSAIRAGLHDGTRGHWIATTKRCVRSACQWTGRFVSPNGHVVASSVQYTGRIPEATHPGTSIPGLLPAGSTLVFPSTGSDLWIALLVAAVLGILGLYWACHKLVANYLRQRRSDSPGQPGRLLGPRGSRLSG